MGLPSNIFVAAPEQAIAYVKTAEHDNAHIVRVKPTDITELELAILWSIIEEIEFDFDEHELEFIDKIKDVNLYRFPDSLIFLLSRLSKDEVERLAVDWANTEEMQSLPEQAQKILTALVNAAQKALSQGKSIYLCALL